MKFLVDMALSPALAAWLQDQGHDAVHAAEAGLSHAQDVDVPDRAVGEGRTIVTVDLDYPRLLALAQSLQSKPGAVSEWQLERCRGYRANG